MFSVSVTRLIYLGLPNKKTPADLIIQAIIATGFALYALHALYALRLGRPPIYQRLLGEEKATGLDFEWPTVKARVRFQANWFWTNIADALRQNRRSNPLPASQDQEP